MKINKLYFNGHVPLSVIISLLFFSVVYPDNSGINKNQSFGSVMPNTLVIKFKSNQTSAVDLINSNDERINTLKKKHRIVSLKKLILNKNRFKKTGDLYGLSRIYYADYIGDKSPVQVAEELSKNPLIEYAEPKYIHYLQIEPNDPLYYQQQAYYNVIHAPEAWDIIQGEDGNTIVAIVDGGTDINHEDLNNNIWVNQIEFNGIPGVDDDNNGYVDDVFGWNFANDSGDPTGLASTPFNADHGTHTAGIAGAVSDNSVGVSGVSWNVSIMAVNASAISDEAIAYGFEGILYAAENGADIISCSWGRLGGYSPYEQDVINTATSMGALVVAAAGNDNSNLAHFPSAYDHVLSIAGTDGDQKWSGSNYGPDIDLAAPAVSIFSTYPGENYGAATGTSMSTPLVAGAVALVKTQNPDWSGIQIGEQVRVTADSIQDFAGRLGKGRLNMLRAVTESSPSVRIFDYYYVDENHSGVIEPGEQVEIYISLINYLSQATNLSLKLLTSDPYVNLISSEAFTPSINTLEQIQIHSPFVIEVADDVPSNYLVEIEVIFQATEYQDIDYIRLQILPSYAELGKNNIGVTITNIGRIGHPDPGETLATVGFSYIGGPDLLFEGAIISGNSASQISNAARGLLAGNDEDFNVSAGGDIVISSPGSLSDEESSAIFDDRNADNPMNLRITQSTYAWSDSANDDYVIFLYVIRNTGSVDLDNFHFGLFFDWDLDGGSFNTNVTGYKTAQNLGFVYDTGDGPGTYVGVSALSDVPVSFRAIYNDNLHPDNPSWGLYDGFSDSEKWDAISGGIVYKDAGPADVSHVISNGPISIPGYSQYRLAFAMIAADDSLSLFKHADSAAVMWSRLVVTELEDGEYIEIPEIFYLGQNYPNPFNPNTIINYQLPMTSEVDLSIYDLLGRKVVTLVSEKQQAGSYQVKWKSDQIASGIYYYMLQADGYQSVKKMILLR